MFDSFARLFGTASEVTATPRHLGEYTRGAADQVLAAEDCEHLAALIDALSGDDAFWSDAEAAARRAIDLKLVRPQRGVGKLDMVSLRAILGTTAAARCERGHNALTESLKEIERLAGSAEEGDRAKETTNEDPSLSSISDMLYDSEIPLIVRKTIAAILRSLASALVIARAEEKGAKLQAWLGFALAESFALPLESALAAIREPNALSNAATALEVDENSRLLMNAAFSQWREHAAATGKTIYFPAGHEAG